MPARGARNPAPGRLWGPGRPAKRTGPRGARLTAANGSRRAKHFASACRGKPGSGAEPMLVATGVASAAVERRKASAPRSGQVARVRAGLSAARAAPADEWRKLRRLVCAGADIGWMRLSALRFPFSAHDLVRKPVTTFRDHARRKRILKDSCSWLGGWQNSGAETRGEKDFVFYPPLQGEGRRAASAARRGGVRGCVGISSARCALSSPPASPRSRPPPSRGR